MDDLFSLFEAIIVDLIAGLVATAMIAGSALIIRRAEPEIFERWAGRLRRFLWPLLAFVFLAASVVFALWRGDPWEALVILGVISLAAVAAILIVELLPVDIPILKDAVVGHEWQILAGLFFVSTLALLVLGPGNRQPPEEQIVFVVSLADEEMIELRDVLDDLEREIGARVFLMSVPAGDYVKRLSAMAGNDAMKWDLIAADNNMLGVLGARGLVEDLTAFVDRDALIPDQLLHRLRPLQEFDGVHYFAPFRPNVKIALYNEPKLAQYGLSPPRDWRDLRTVACRLKEEERVGRVAIQGHPGPAAAVTVFEFVSAFGGDPLTLADEGSRSAFEFLKQLESCLSRQYKETKFDTANTLLVDDEVYLVMNWPFAVKVVVEDAGRTDVKAYSGWSGPKEEAHVLGGDVLAIPNGAPNPDGAARLMKALLSIEVQRDLFERLWWLPVRADAYEDVPDWLDPYLGAILDALGNAALRPKEPQWTAAEKILDECFGQIVRDDGLLTLLDGCAERLAESIPPCFILHGVQSGETWGPIANRYDTTPEDLATWNQMTPGSPLPPGSILLVPNWDPPVGQVIEEGICKGRSPDTRIPELRDGRIVVGSDISFEPFEFFGAGNDTPAGFDVDLFVAAATRLGVEVEWNDIDFAEILPALSAGLFEVVVSGMTVTETRDEVADFVPYFHAGITLLVADGNPRDIHDLDDLSGQRVSTQLGTTWHNLIEDTDRRLRDAGQEPIVIELHDTSAEAVEQLRSGNADAVVTDRPVADYFASREPDIFDSLSDEILLEAASFGWAVRETSPELKVALADALDELIADGTYEKVLTEWDLQSGSIVGNEER